MDKSRFANPPDLICLPKWRVRVDLVGGIRVEGWTQEGRRGEGPGMVLQEDDWVAVWGLGLVRQASLTLSLSGRLNFHHSFPLSLSLEALVLERSTVRTMPTLNNQASAVEKYDRLKEAVDYSN